MRRGDGRLLEGAAAAAAAGVAVPAPEQEQPGDRFDVFCDAIASSSSLSRLNFDEMGPECAVLLAGALARRPGPPLRRLDISCCEPGPPGARRSHFQIESSSCLS